MKEIKPLPLGNVYLHLNNGGVTFEVQDHVGPTIIINSSSFGNIDHILRVFTNSDGLREIGEMFITASKHKFRQEEYVCAAKIPMPVGKAGGEARASSLSPKRRKEIAVKAANSRWKKK